MIHVSRENPVKLVSVIIVNFNGGRLLLEAAAAALYSTIPVELLISDNGSTDGSLNAVYKAFGKDRRVHIISNGSNLGFSRANNIALKQAKGKYILLLNPDCIIRPDTLSKMLGVMETNPDVGMAGCLITNPDGSEQPGCRRSIPTPWRSFVRVFHLNTIFPDSARFKTFHLHREPLPEQPSEVEAISGAFMLAKRESINQIGTLDEEYFMHCEDLDWCMRFRQAGWKILFVPDAIAIHHKGTCSKKSPIRVLYHMHRGMICFYRKFFRKQYPFPLIAIVISTVWARFLTLAVKELLKRPFRKRFINEPYKSPSLLSERRNLAPVIAYIGTDRRVNKQRRVLNLHTTPKLKREPTTHEKA